MDRFSLPYLSVRRLSEALDEDQPEDSRLDDQLDLDIGEEDEYEPTLVLVDEKW